MGESALATTRRSRSGFGDTLESPADGSEEFFQKIGPGFEFSDGLTIQEQDGRFELVFIKNGERGGTFGTGGCVGFYERGGLQGKFVS